MKKHVFYWLALAFVVVMGCQKETSFELGNTPAQGSLQSEITGDCLPKSVNGVYVAGTPLVTATNTITVSVNVTRTGIYTITTDTVNGYYFKGTGTFTALGSTTITLRSNGTPFVDGTDNFVVSFDGSVCSIAVDVLPAGSGGPAVFTLAGAPAACTGAVVSGTYGLSIPLTATNTVLINVNVTTIGTYNITTTFQGMTFSKTGVFAATGPTTVTLVGSGTPTTQGVNTVPLTVGATTCSFPVTVTGPAVGTLGGATGACTPSTVSGIYVIGNTMTVDNKVQVQLNVTAAGSYTISTNTVTGFSFSGTGTAALGLQLIDLTGTGTPTTAGPQTFTVTFGTSTCTFTVNVLPADYFPRTTNSNWSYEFDNVATDSLYRLAIAATKVALANTYNIFMQSDDGTQPPPDSSGYYRRAGGSYYEWFDYGNYIGFDNPGWAEYIMVKDDVPAATNWKSAAFGGTVTGTPLNVRFSYTVVQKDVPISVTSSLGTINYQNVIVVEEKYEVEVTPGVWQDATATLNFYGKSYYARGIGLIKFEAYNALNAVTGVQELRRFQVF